MNLAASSGVGRPDCVIYVSNTPRYRHCQATFIDLTRCIHSHLSACFSDDFRIFAGDLGNDVTEDVLTRYFSVYPSFVKAKVVRDKRSNKTKGYGFISFRESDDYVRAMKEMNGKRPGVS